MDLSGLISGKQHEKMHWGESLGLYDIARFKIIGIPILEIFIAQAMDNDLKAALNRGMEMIIIPHVERIQGFLLKEGVRDVPQVIARLNLDKSVSEPNTMLKDHQIAGFTREIFRFGLILDIRGLTDSTRDDIRALITDIFNDDNRSFDALIKLMRTKNWLLPPPTI